MSQGRVRYFQRANRNWDVFTGSTDPALRSFIRKRVTGIQTYTTYFDDKLSWFPAAWVYFDIYAIYTDGPVAKAHPEWILKDATGNKLFIPWGCKDGTCPQYAGDITNPAFRAYQIDQIQQILTAHQYLGLFLDDVNLLMRVSDGTGKAAVPIASVTGAPMGQSAWASAMADFTELVRAAMPPALSIIHNSLWNAASSVSVDRQIQSADIINLERGFGDTNLTAALIGGMMQFIDRVHALGKTVLVDEYYCASNMFSLACYLLVNNGGDFIGFGDQLPDATWSDRLYTTDLGAASTGRVVWSGLQRRDFTRGMVLANTGTTAISATLPSVMFDSTGAAVSAVNLPPVSGAILHSPKVA